MPFAARVGDSTGHPGTIVGPGESTVLIGGIPASVVGDMHSCLCPSNPPHSPSPFSMGSTSVLIKGRQALRMGDVAGCGAPIILGATNVTIGDRNG